MLVLEAASPSLYRGDYFTHVLRLEAYSTFWYVRKDLFRAISKYFIMK